jgi:hypothetical protein
LVKPNTQLIVLFYICVKTYPIKSNVTMNSHSSKVRLIMLMRIWNLRCKFLYEFPTDEPLVKLNTQLIVILVYQCSTYL